MEPEPQPQQQNPTAASKLGTLINRTTIDLFIDHSKQAKASKDVSKGENGKPGKATLGIVNFSTEDYKMKMGDVDIKSDLQEEVISYKNVNNKGEEGDDDKNEEEKERGGKKRVIENNRVTIRPKKISKKVFVVNIPKKSVRPNNSKTSGKDHLVLEFSTSSRQGRLNIISEYQEANIQILNTKKNQKTTEQKIEFQNKLLDNRRKDKDQLRADFEEYQSSDSPVINSDEY